MRIVEDILIDKLGYINQKRVRSQAIVYFKNINPSIITRIISNIVIMQGD
jgi:hypothetical protein